ncbi:uncharacterized protein [Littorina saxatilis]|uniref:F-box domain-containing protein n=1 Tax=Littorina saxatilis TaxID=31220 RepID=A0AAN9G737_9CAEN
MASSETGSTHYQGEGDDTEGPDFSCLPDVVWVKVLQLLDVTDRYHVSLTCSRLHAHFGHPSGWSHATLDLSVSYDGELEKYSDLSVLQHKHSVLQYVKVDIQKLRLPLQVMSPEEISTLLELPLSKNLKSLKINLNFDIIELKRVIENNDTAHLSSASVLNELCDRAPEKLLVELVLIDLAISDFSSENAPCEVFDSLGPKTWYQRVTSLSFPHGSLSEETQFSLYPQLTSSPTAVLVSRFLSLRCLSLSVVNLSDQLLYQLADMSRSHCSLRSFTIHFRLCCNRSFTQEIHSDLVELSSSAWGGLVSVCSNLEVSCFLGEAVTLKELCSVVRPEAPVVSVQFLYRVDKGIEAFVPFCLQHSQTLQRFTYNECLTSVIKVRCQRRADRGGSLVSMVTECPRLRHLVYIGEIHNEDVVKLAELNRQWTTFVFQDKLFLLDARDKLYSPGCRGDLSPAVRAAQKATLIRMCDHVSRHLGYPWKPRDS